MILGITNIGNGELAVIGLGMVGLYLLGHLGRRLIDLTIDRMRHYNDAFDADTSLDEHYDSVPRDRDYPTVDADTYGEHARVETTGFLPRVAALPVDDTAAFAAVDSVTGLGDGR